MRLYVVVARGRGERIAAEDLQRLGLAAYAPVERRWSRTPHGKRVKVDRPVFPRLVFVATDDIVRDFGLIRSARRVEGVLGADGKPQALRCGEQSLIAGVLVAESWGWLDDTLPKQLRCSIGEKVRILKGMFKGHIGTLTLIRGDKVRVEVDGRFVRGAVSLGRDDVVEVVD